VRPNHHDYRAKKEDSHQGNGYNRVRPERNDMNLGKSPIAAQEEPSWNIGIMEYWNDGLTERKNQICSFRF
jgi:hypothetical protein